MAADVVSYEAGGVTVRPGPGGPQSQPHPGDVALTRRTGRVDRRPSRPELFVDRVDERAKCRLTPPFVLELYGEYGVGKTTLLSAMTHELADARSFADGVLHGDDVFYSSYDEFLYYVWDHFYASNLPHRFVPSPGMLHHALRDLEVLLVIDDCAFSERELKSLHAIAGRCGLMIASEGQQLTDIGRSLLVPAMPPDVARDLARAQLRRQFADERLLSDETVAKIWAECRGNARLFERSIARWVQGGLPAPAEAALIDIVMQLCGQSPVPVEVLEAVAADGPSGIADLADDLWRRREINAHSPRYSVRWQLLHGAGAGVAVHQRAFGYLADEVDFDERPDLRPFALGLLEAATAVGSGALPAAAMALRSDPSVAERAATMAGRLADSYLSSGALDGWQRAAVAIERLTGLGRVPSSPRSTALARHHLGANALCRGEFVLAERRLRDVVGRYYRLLPGSRAALEAALALYDIAVRSSGQDPDDGTAGSSPPRPDPSGFDPAATWTVPVAAGVAPAEAAEEYDPEDTDVSESSGSERDLTH